MNWMLIPSALMLIVGVMMFARPQWGIATRRLERRHRGASLPGKLIDEAVMSDMALATLLIVLGGMGIFGLAEPLDLLRP